MESLTRGKDNRIEFISWLQFVGVFLVIMGHSMNSIAVPEIFTMLKAWFYTFHMPLFFFTSAFLFSHKEGVKGRGYKNVLIERAIRLLIPYIIWNIVFVVPKIIMAPYINDQVDLSIEYFIKIFLSPRDQILGHTWFLFALFEMFIFTAFFETLRKNKMLWIPSAFFLIVVNCFGVEMRFLAIGDLMKNSIFFWVGLILGAFDIEKIKEWCGDKVFVAFMIILLIWSTAVWIFYKDMEINTVVLGSSSLVLLVVFQMNLNIHGKLIRFISENSFSIYILHWPIMMLIRFLVYTKLHVEPTMAMIIVLICGLVIPAIVVIFIKKIKGMFLRRMFSFILGIKE